MTPTLLILEAVRAVLVVPVVDRVVFVVLEGTLVGLGLFLRLGRARCRLLLIRSRSLALTLLQCSSPSSQRRSSSRTSCFLLRPLWRLSCGQCDEELWLHAPADLNRRWRKPNGNLEIPSSFEVAALEFSSRAGRGPTTCALLFDEMAHVDEDLASSADEVYRAAVPSLDQFRGWEWIYLASSPRTQAGRFYTEYKRALELNEDGTPAYPDILTLQIASWDMYRDWERTGPEGDLRLYPGGPPFPRINEPVLVLDQEMERERRADPVTFAVEREAQWSSGSSPYLLPNAVDEMFGPFEGRLLEQQKRGLLNVIYYAHGDPALNHCNFSFVIAHLEWIDGEPHVFFDRIDVWRPQDFSGHVIDFPFVESQIQRLIQDFAPAQVTFDQYNFAGSIQRLDRFAAEAKLPRRPQVYERTATAGLNQRTAELFRNNVNLGRIHAPHHQLAIDELKALQYDGKKVIAPTTGPVQTKDVADALMIVSYELLNAAGEGTVGQRLGGLELHASLPGGIPRLAPNHPLSEAFTRAGRYGRQSPQAQPRRPRRGDRQ